MGLMGTPGSAFWRRTPVCHVLARYKIPKSELGRNVPSRLPVLTAEPGTPSHDALRIPQLELYEWWPTTRVRSTRDLMSSLSKT
jgi:hypothetical protein